MSDFLAALARRAVMPPGVRPRNASSFEDGGWKERSEQVEIPAPATAAAPPVPARREAAPQPRPDAVSEAPARAPERPRGRFTALPDASLERGMLAAPTRPAADPAPLPRKPAARSESPAEPPPARGSRPPANPRADAPAAPAIPVPPPVVERVTRERTEQHTFRSLIKSGIVERLTAAPGRPRSAPAPAASVSGAPQQPAEPASPRIEIHIGRIEVMPANSPVAEPQRVETPRPLPPQSLAAYLSERAKS